MSIYMGKEECMDRSKPSNNAGADKKRGESLFGRVRGRIVKYCKKNEAEHRFFSSLILKEDDRQIRQVKPNNSYELEDMLPE